MKIEDLQSNLDGKSGEYAVASQLLRRGILVEWPSVDIGYDLITTSNRARIQVKTSHPIGINNKYGYPPECYWFALPKVKHRYTNSGTKKIVKRKEFSSVCDFVIFYGMDDERYWIVPSADCDESTAFIMGYENPRRFYGDVNELRELNKSGYSHREIAEKFNCSRVTITKLINSNKDYQKPSKCEVGRRCENAWDKITIFGKPEAVENQVEKMNGKFME